MTLTIKVSHSCFNELAAQMERLGIQINQQNDAITISKGTTILPPVDMRLATMRRDCLVESVKLYAHDQSLDVVELANKMFEFVLNGKTLNKDKEGKSIDHNKEGWK